MVGMPGFRPPALVGLLPAKGKRDSASAVTLVVNGVQVAATGSLAGDAVAVPLGPLLSDLGLTLAWSGAEAQAKLAGDNVLTLWAGTTAAQMGDSAVTVTPAPRLVGGRLVVPLSPVAAALGVAVGWDPEQLTVYLQRAFEPAAAPATPAVEATPAAQVTQAAPPAPAAVEVVQAAPEAAPEVEPALVPEAAAEKATAEPPPATEAAPKTESAPPADPPTPPARPAPPTPPQAPSWSPAYGWMAQTNCGLRAKVETRTIKEETPDLVTDIEYPWLTEIPPAAMAKINGVFAAWAAKAQEAGKQAVEEANAAAPGGSPIRPFQDYGRYLVGYNAYGLFSLYLEHYLFAGGAHGMTYRTPYTFDLTAGYSYSLQDLFRPNVNYVALLSQEIKRQMDQRGLTASLLTPFNAIKPDEKYYIKDGNLVIFFDLYEYFPYAWGFQEFPIPMASLRPYLRPEFAAIPWEKPCP